MSKEITPVPYTPMEYVFLFVGTKDNWVGSKSGGAFYTLAKFFVSCGWYVCGAVYDENLNVKHIVSNKLEDVERMRGML